MVRSSGPCLLQIDNAKQSVDSCLQLTSRHPIGAGKKTKIFKNSQIAIETKSLFFFSSRRRHTRCSRDWSSDVCSSDLHALFDERPGADYLRPNQSGHHSA